MPVPGLEESPSLKPQERPLMSHRASAPWPQRRNTENLFSLPGPQVGGKDSLSDSPQGLRIGNRANNYDKQVLFLRCLAVRLRMK